MERLRDQITAESRTATQENGQHIQQLVTRMETATVESQTRERGSQSARQAHIALLTSEAESANQAASARGARFASELKVALERTQQALQAGDQRAQHTLAAALNTQAEANIAFLENQQRASDDALLLLKRDMSVRVADSDRARILRVLRA